MNTPEELMPLLSLVARRTTNAVVLTDALQRILWVNEAFERLSGYSLAEVEGKVPGHFLQCKRTDPEVVETVRKALHAGEPCKVSLLNRSKSGASYWVEMDIQPIKDAGGKLTHFVAIQQDISKQIRTEEELRKSRDKFQSLVASIPGVAYRRLPDAGWTMVYMSPDLDSVLGFAPEVFLGEGGKNYSEMICAEDLSAVKRAMGQAVAAGEFWEVEYRVMHPEKGLRWVHEKGHAVFGETGEPEFFDGYILDISERKTIEETLKSERNLFSSGPVCTIIWGTAPEWPIRYISSNAVFILGYSVEEMTHADFRYASLIHPEDLAWLVPEIEHNIRHHINTYEQSYRIKVKDGYYAWFYDFTELVRDAEGNLKEIRGYLYEQTQQKTLESTLAFERQRLAQILEGTNVGTWEWNVQSGETVFNERWAQIIGCSLEEISPTTIETWEKFVHPDDMERSRDLLQKHFRGETDYYESEVRMRHKSGEWIWVLDRGSVSERDDAGNPLVLSGTHQDIHGRKKNEEALLASEQMLSQAQRLARLGSWRLDFSSGDLSWSDEIYRIFGMRPQEFPSTYEAFLEAVHPEDREAVDAAYRNSLEVKNSHYEIDHRIVRKDTGEIRHVHEFCHHEYDSQTGEILESLGTVQDITDRKRAEEIIRSTETRFRTLFQISPDATVLIDSETGKALQFNRTAHEQLGYSAEEFAGLGISDFEAVETPEEILAHTGAILAKGRDDFETKHRRKDGSLIDVKVTVKPFEMDGKKVMLCVYRDVSHQKRTEEALRKKTEELERYFDSSLDLLCISDVDGHFLRLNPQWEIALGYPIAELEGLCYTDFLHPEDLEKTEEVMVALRDQREVDSFENRFRAKDGSFRWIEWRSRAEGKLIYAVARDITDRKAVESRLRESYARYDELAEQSRTVTWEIDTEGRYTHLSHVAESLFGYRPDEVVGEKYFYDLHPENEREDFKEQAFELMGQRIRILDFENPIQTKSGRIVWVNTNALPVFAEDESLAGYRGSDTDITDRKEAESLLRESNRLLEESIAQANELRRKAEEASRAKSSFLATMSHEIRTPMNAVIGMTSLLQHSNLDEDQKEFVSLIQSGGETLLSLISDILDFSKIEAGQLELENLAFDLKRCVGETIEMLQVKALEAQIGLSCSIGEDCPEEVVGDKARLRQVLINLVSNAIKFTEEGGVSVRVNAVLAGGGAEAKWRVDFVVADTGIGMDEAAKEKLFQPFTQADSSVTRRFGGTGLGLSICKKIVTAMGGEIAVESWPGKGSEFSFFVLLGCSERCGGEGAERPRDASPEDFDELFAEKYPLSVLVVDDSFTNQRVIVHMLAKLGYEPVLAQDGNEAVALFKAGGDDLIFMDLQMPNMGGIEAAKAIRLETGHRQPYIVALTAGAMRENREQSFEAGMDEYLSKPIKLEAVYEVIRRAFLFRQRE